MQIIDNGKFVKLIADEGKKIFSPDTNSYHKMIILGKNEKQEKYREVNDPKTSEQENDTNVTMMINDTYTINKKEQSINVDEMITIFNTIINK